MYKGCGTSTQIDKSHFVIKVIRLGQFISIVLNILQANSKSAFQNKTE